MSGLEELLANATPGPWEFSNSSDVRGHKGEFRAPNPFNGFMLVGPWTNDHDARLIALAPDLARLCLDMGEKTRSLVSLIELGCNADDMELALIEARALLARLDGIADNKDAA